MNIDITAREQDLIEKMLIDKSSQYQVRIKELEKGIARWNNPKFPSLFKTSPQEKKEEIEQLKNLINKHTLKNEELQSLLIKLCKANSL